TYNVHGWIYEFEVYNNTGAPTVPPPTLTSISPNTGVPGTTLNVTLTGTGLASGLSVLVSGGDIIVGPVVVVSSSSATATFTIPGNATPGAHFVTVTTPAGTSNAVTFTVRNPVPTLTSISPNTGTAGTTPNVALAGTGFAAGQTIAVSGGDITVS